MKHPTRRTPKTRGIKPALAFLCATAALACAVSAPDEACAYYYDYDTANTAQQEVDISGSPIPGSAIPDGVYMVGARTSSRMCILYPSAEEVEKGQKSDYREMCYISVEGGAITAVFYTSKAYTRICLGPGDYAASLSDETGTNDAPYMVGDPAEGYVPHLYTFPVNALNEPIVFSTFDGASPGRSIADQKWYTRTVAFTPTDDVMRAINGETDDGSGSGQDPDASGDANDSSAAMPDNTADDENAGNSTASHRPAGATGAADGSGNSNGSGNPNDSNADDKPTDEQQKQPTTQNSTDSARKRGVPIAVANADEPAAPMAVQQAEPQDDVPKGLSTTQILGLAIAAIMIAGIAARVVIFTLSKRSRP